MICFPLDNTVYNATALGAWLGTRTRGVFAADGHYTVTANGDMSVTLGPGIAWLKPNEFWGTVVFEADATILPIATADGSLTRYAAICLRLDKNANLPFAVVKYGPYGTNPGIGTLPLPEHSLDYDEVYVAAIRSRAGATEILATDIIDLRLNEAYCGVMRDGVTGIPTQGLYKEFRGWLESLRDLLDENAAANLAGRILQLEGLACESYPLTLLAANWAADTYTISDPRIRADNMDISPVIAGDATMPEKEAYDKAWIWPVDQSDESVVLKAHGVVPSIDLPIVLMIIRYAAR